jgi:hypothetical protein
MGHCFNDYGVSVSAAMMQPGEHVPLGVSGHLLALHFQNQVSRTQTSACIIHSRLVNVLSHLQSDTLIIDFALLVVCVVN